MSIWDDKRRNKSRRGNSRAHEFGSGCTLTDAARMQAHNMVCSVVQFLKGGGKLRPEDAIDTLLWVQHYIDDSQLAIATLAARWEQRDWEQRLAGKHL
jgi:ATP:corrinoid adenosyltransferase